jgi:16S rRNA processing protein RimM
MMDSGGRPDAALVRVGRVGRPHGIAGELYLDGSSLTALELHAIKHFVWRRRGVAPLPLTLEAARPANTRLLVRFAGITVREQAAGFTNGELWADRAVLPDPGPREAYTFQLVGLRVETEDGRALGVVQDVVTTGAQAIYIVKGERELLVPGAPGVLKRVDLAAGLMVVALPAGLEDL